MVKAIKRRNVIPGFGLSMGITLTMLGLVVLIPLATLVVVTFEVTFEEFWAAITHPRTMSAYRVTLITALVASVVTMFFGALLAWILTRYKFFGRRFLDGLVEMPLAMPNAVSGLALTMLYSPDGWIGSIFARAGIQISHTTIGITIAMVFVGIPFVVRTIQPVLEKLDPQYEQAAEILGASKARTFVKIILPEIVPIALIGFGLAFARAIGEFGSVMFISGNMPFQTQVVSMEIVSRLEQHQHHASASIALVMLVFSFAVLLAINIIQSKLNKMAKGDL